MTVTDPLVDAAQRLLEAGHGIDAVVARLRADGLESILLIKALREAADLYLPDAVAIVEATREGRDLAHLTGDRLPLLARARRAGGGWWTNLYCDAVLADVPWLTMVPGRDSAALGSVYFWKLPEPPPTAELWLTEMRDPASPEQREAFRRRLEHDPELVRTHPGSISGPGVSYHQFRAALREHIAGAPFWRDHAELVRDDDHALTCRFTIA